MRKKPHPALIKFGENVRNVRERLSWTQESLANAADVDQTFISGIERGARNPTVITISKLAKALNVSAAELCGGIEQ
jgi:transcriptional regulator with XRE-family HTH domain